MAWNPFKPKPGADTQPAPAGAASDNTDPLIMQGGYEEHVKPLWSSAGGEVDEVSVGGPAGPGERFLRYSLREPGLRADALRSLWLSLPEAHTGFRDLLLREGYALSASFTPPDACFSHLAPGQAGVAGLLRARDLLGALDACAALLVQVESNGNLGWVKPQAAQLGLRRVGPAGPAGYARWELQFCGWDALEPGERTDTAALAWLLDDPLRWLVEQAQAADGAAHWCLREVEALREAVLDCANAGGSGLSDLRAALGGLRPRSYSAGGWTDVGRRRDHNEDAFLLLTQDQRSAFGSKLTLCAVADGMGGHASGEVASSLALDLLRLQLAQLTLPPRSRTLSAADLEQDLKTVIVGIGRALVERAALEPGQAGMGTTLTGVALLAPQSTLAADLPAPSACVFNVGDSRSYLLSAQGLAQLSRDHSFVGELLATGQLTEEEAFTHPQKNVITRCLGGGGGGDSTPDVFRFSPGPGEILMLCSDGLTDALRAAEVCRVLDEVPYHADSQGLPAYLEALATALIAAANDAGGPDNISVVLVACCR
jgi:protein phosphatase